MKARQRSTVAKYAEVLGRGVLGGLRKHQDWFTTGDLARACGTTLRAIRHYEKLGLIRASGRSEGRHRIFPPSEHEKVRLISDMRQMGLPLRSIGEMFGARECSKTGREASRRTLDLIKVQAALLERRIQALHRTRDELLQMAGRLEICTECDLPLCDDRCRDCDRLGAHDVPRLVRLLWLREGQRLICGEPRVTQDSDKPECPES